MYFIAFIHLIVSSKNIGNGLPFPLPGYLPDPGIDLISPSSPALAGGFFAAEPPAKLHILLSCFLMWKRNWVFIELFSTVGKCDLILLRLSEEPCRMFLTIVFSKIKRLYTVIIKLKSLIGWILPTSFPISKPPCNSNQRGASFLGFSESHESEILSGLSTIVTGEGRVVQLTRIEGLHGASFVSATSFQCCSYNNKKVFAKYLIIGNHWEILQM